MKNIIKITFVTAMLALFTGCETTELDLLDNPNAISADVASPNFVLNSIQLSFNGIVSGFRGSSSNITRMTAQFGQYNGSVTVTFIKRNMGICIQHVCKRRPYRGNKCWK